MPRSLSQIPDLPLHKFYAARLAGYTVYSRPLSEYISGEAAHHHWSPERAPDLAFRLSMDAQIDLRPCTRSVYASRGRITVQLKYSDYPGSTEHEVAQYAVILCASKFQQALEANARPQVPLGL